MKPISKEPANNENSSPAWLINLHASINSLKHKIAQNLTKQSERLSPLQKKWYLLTIGVLTGGLCLALVLQPVIQWNDKAIPYPANASQYAIVPQPNPGLFTEEDYLLLTRFKLTMDSIYKVDRITYDELLKEHHGLMDTVNLLIKTYTSN